MKKIPAGQEYSGFLKDYTKLKPVPASKEARGYASTDAQKNLRKYIACVIDPVEVYLASDADGAKMSETARSAVTEYFRAALVKSVSSAYPVVEKPGPLVLRLRAAVVGVDFGGEVSAADKAADKDARHHPQAQHRQGPGGDRTGGLRDRRADRGPRGQGEAGRKRRDHLRNDAATRNGRPRARPSMAGRPGSAAS